MRWMIAALLAATASGSAGAAPMPAPKLIVAISVDQFSAALFEEYRSHFTGGLKRVAEGVVFANGYQAHATTETCSGHSTILTGSHPARTGIIANDWRDLAAPRADKNVYCAEDERAPGSTSEDYQASAVHLRALTLGERMKDQNSASRVVAVAGKDRAAIMMAGHRPDQLWWWKDGQFVSDGAVTPQPVVAAVNAAIANSIAQPRPALAPPAFCASKDRPIEVGGRTVGTFRFDRAAGDAEAFGRGPEKDAATLALAAALIQTMQLGQGQAPDLIAIGLSASDHVGHRYGPGGLEMCLQLMSLDSDLGGFLNLLDRTGIDYAVVLTADHGGLDIPERQKLLGRNDAVRLDPALSVQSVGADIGRQLGLASPAFDGEGYMATDLPPSRRGEVVALAKQMLAGKAQVYGVYGKDEISAHPLPLARPEDWSVLDRLRASFDPVRSPDIEIIYKPEVTLIANPDVSVATHGSPWDYDRKVPILFWWKGISGQMRGESAMTVDIEPTLASLIGLRIPPSEIDGHCLDLMASAADNCR